MQFQAPYDIVDMRNQQMREEQMRQEQAVAQREQMMSAIASLAGTFAQDQATKAKGKAYGDFLGKHGEQLGFNPEYLQDFLKKKPAEQAMIGDSIVGMQNTGRNLMSLNYLNQQADRYPRTGGGGGGGGAFFTMPGE